MVEFESFFGAFAAFFKWGDGILYGKPEAFPCESGYVMCCSEMKPFFW